MRKVTVNTYKKDKYYPRVARATAKLLAKSDVLAPVNVLMEMEILTKADYDAWKKGQIPYLERVIQVNLAKASRILRIIGFHAQNLNLVPSHTAYCQSGKGKRPPLRFSKYGDKNLEEAYSRHYIKKKLQDKKKTAVKQAQPEPPNTENSQGEAQEAD